MEKGYRIRTEEERKSRLVEYKRDSVRVGGKWTRAREG